MMKKKTKTPFLFFILSSILNYQNMFILKNNHFRFFLFHVFFLITIISVEIVVVSSQSIDQRFEACCPQDCGNGKNISYPFWIDGIHQDYCGYPEFKVTCKNGEPVLQSSGNDYIIRDIFYKKQSFRVGKGPEFDSCPSPFQNVSFASNSLFKLGPNIVNLSFFYNCTNHTAYFPNGPDTNSVFYPKNCRYTDSQHFSVVMASVPASLDYWNSRCKTLVLVPVEVGGRELSTGFIDRGNYTLLLENGFLLEWNKMDCNQCEDSGGYCGIFKEVPVCICGYQPYLNPCNIDGPKAGVEPGEASLRLQPTHYGSRKRNKIAIGITAGAAGVIISSVTTIIICCCMRKKYYSLHSHSTTFLKKKLNGNDHQNMEIFFKNCGSLAPKRYIYSDVKKMTNSFEQKLGEGGFGSVFKGKLQDGMLVAVKVLFSKSGRDGEDFINEVASISRTSHVNIVTLHGFCFEKKKMALIYEYMPNGSLEKFIYNKAQSDQLGWETVYQISIGIARGLEYLHRGCNTQILHFDIKPHNVLLDQDFCPKISDFGLAKLCLRKESMVSILCARGTAGYIAPELFSRNFGRVSYKSDVYSYGMMILEMVGGRKNIDVNVGMDHSSQLYFPHWIYERLERNEDLELHGVLTEEREELARKMIIVGLWCIQTNPLSRPSMSKVLEMLQGTLESLEIPPKPTLSSPAKSPPMSSSTLVSALQIQSKPTLSSLLESTSVSSSTIVSIS